MCSQEKNCVGVRGVTFRYIIKILGLFMKLKGILAFIIFKL